MEEKLHMTDDYSLRMYTPPDPSLTEYDELEDYALTIDGYRYAEEGWHVQPNSQEHWLNVQCFKKKGKWNGSFEDLRGCLFAYQRSVRWLESGAFDREGRAEFMKIYSALCKAWEKGQSHRSGAPASKGAATSTDGIPSSGQRGAATTSPGVPSVFAISCRT
ncbi:MAG: hypothetical protein Q7J31_14745 [Syntrophales bacterium]|nr:hypothetical protein [Syntrophales bacterium]